MTKYFFAITFMLFGFSFFSNCNRSEQGYAEVQNFEEDAIPVEEAAPLLVMQVDSMVVPVEDPEEEEKEEEEILPPDFLNNIIFTNCSITTDFTVPGINNYTFGINDGDVSWDMIDKNLLRPIWGGFQIVLRNDISLDYGITVIARNSKFEFTQSIELEVIRDNRWNYSDNNPLLGYYQNVNFEPKFWLSDGSVWQILVKAGDEVLIDDYLSLGIMISLFFGDLNETPFIVDNLHYVELNKDYTYRCIKKGTDIIVVYYTKDYGFYEPVLYLIPDKNDDHDYYDIGVSWLDETVKGIYHFGRYTFDNLPRGQRNYGVFDFVRVR